MNVSASRSSIAVSGDVRDSTFNVGLDEESVGKVIEQAHRPLLENFAEIARQVSRAKGVDPAPLRAILAKLGDSNVPDEKIADRLSEKADQFIELQRSLKAAPDDELSWAKKKASDLLNAGEFKDAYGVLEAGRTAAREQRESAARREAEFLADQAAIDDLQLAYLSAAEKYSAAYRLIAEDAGEAFKYLVKQATALQNQGEQFADNNALREAIIVWQSAKNLRQLDIAPDDHRKAHNNLGSAVYALAERETDNVRLHEVIALNREVLERDTYETAPVYWVAAKANLAAAMQKLGERERKSDLILVSIGHGKELLKYVDETKEPHKWAGILNNIGNGLTFVAQDQKNEERLKEAIASFREALSVLKGEEHRSQRAPILLNLAAALTELGRMRNTADPFEESIEAISQAIELSPKNVDAVLWARAQLNLSGAFNSLGVVTNNVQYFESAIHAANEGLSVFTREAHPFQWINGRWGIGAAAKLIAERIRDLSRAAEAVEVFEEINDILQRASDERLKPRVADALAEARALLLALRGNPARVH